MYEVQFKATDDADWKRALELIDDSTSLPLDADAVADAVFKIEVSDCGSAVLSASTDDDSGIFTKPDAQTVQWRFPASMMAGLETRKTYAVGVTMTNLDGSVEQILVGSLAIVDGGF